MPKMPTLKEILDSNSAIDPQQLQQLQELLRKLRETRTQRKGYRLASPVTRRRVVVGETEHIDPRAIRLRSRH